jgi:hypothetical protein
MHLNQFYFPTGKVLPILHKVNSPQLSGLPYFFKPCYKFQTNQIWDVYHVFFQCCYFFLPPTLNVFSIWIFFLHNNDVSSLCFVMTSWECRLKLGVATSRFALISPTTTKFLLQNLWYIYKFIWERGLLSPWRWMETCYSKCILYFSYLIGLEVNLHVFTKLITLKITLHSHKLPFHVFHCICTILKCVSNRICTS